MKRTLITTILASSALLMAACGGKDADYSKMTNAEKIVGTWTVDSVDMSEAGMTMNMSDVKQVFKADSTFEMEGAMTVSGGGMPGKIGMKFDGSGTYSVEGDALTSTVTAVNGEITEIPDAMESMKDMMNEQMAAGMKDQTSTQTIVVLDAKTLTLKDADTGVQMSMSRK